MTADDVVQWANGQRPDVTAEQVAAWAGDLNHQIQTTQADADAAVAALARDRDALAAQLAATATPAGAEIPVAELVGRLIPLYVAIAVSPDRDALKAKWDTILAPLGLLNTVDLRDPKLALLVGLAKADGLLDDAGAAAVLAGG